MSCLLGYQVALGTSETTDLVCVCVCIVRVCICSLKKITEKV